MLKPTFSLLTLLLTHTLFATTFTVYNPGDAGQGTLREAINHANWNPGPDEIVFNIGNSTSHQEITLDALLPHITDPLIINGFSQPGASEVSGTKRILISGREVTGFSNKYIFVLSGNSSGSTIKGVILDGIAGGGCIDIQTADNHIYGNFLGTNAYGDMSAGVPDMIALVVIPYFDGITGNLVGGTSDTERNVISGNADGYGVYVSSNHESTNSNEIIGNYIGLDHTGNKALPNEVGIVTSYANKVGIFHNVIAANQESGIDVHNSTNIIIASNTIGLNAKGTETMPNNYGIYFFNTSYSIINNNYISGNNLDGIILIGTSTNNSIRANSIGFYRGENHLFTAGNGRNGILIGNESEFNLIGGENLIIDGDEVVLQAGNFISGNQENGIDCRGCSNNIIEGNTIGLSKSGNETSNTFLTSGNLQNGILLRAQASNNRIGSFISLEEENISAANIIGANRHSGIALEGDIVVQQNPDSNEEEVLIMSNNEIVGNLIGLNTKNVAVPNQAHGIYTIKAAEIDILDNVICYNERSGIFVALFNSNYFSKNVGHLIKGNLIGTDLTDGAAGNGLDGLTIEASECTIEDNIIGTNQRYGIGLITNTTPWSPKCAKHIIKRNKIGINRQDLPAGNWSSGLFLQDSHENTIGSTNYGVSPFADANIIAYNGDDGITLNIGSHGSDNNRIFENQILENYGNGIRVDRYSVHNPLISNQLYRNGGLGIELLTYYNGLSGVDINDPLDPDAGGNGLQNYPVLAEAYTINGGTQFLVSGKLNSWPNQTYLVEVYYNPAGGTDPSGHGEGYEPVFRFMTSTGSDGYASFNEVSPALAFDPEEGYITATATRIKETFLGTLIYGTSEFSENKFLSEAPNASISNPNYASDSVENGELIALYPNPATQAIQVALPSTVNDLVDVSIFDSSGKLVLHKNAPADDFRGGYRIDISGLVAGTYLLHASAPAYSGKSTFVKH